MPGEILLLATVAILGWASSLSKNACCNPAPDNDDNTAGADESIHEQQGVKVDDRAWHPDKCTHSASCIDESSNLPSEKDSLTQQVCPALPEENSCRSCVSVADVSQVSSRQGIPPRGQETPVAHGDMPCSIVMLTYSDQHDVVLKEDESSSSVVGAESTGTGSSHTFPATLPNGLHNTKDTRDTNVGPKTESNMNLQSSGIKGLKKLFPRGCRVQIAVPSAHGQGEGTKNRAARFIRGSVVKCKSKASVLVQLDGTDTVTVVPVNACRHVQENHDKVLSKGRVPSTSKQDKRKLQPKSGDENIPVNSSAEQLSNYDPNSAFEPATTVQEALLAGGWRLVRRKNHRVYRRNVMDETGKFSSTITLTADTTGSDHRGEKNQLARLNKLNRQYGVVRKHKKLAKNLSLEKTRPCHNCQKFKSALAFSNLQWSSKHGICLACTYVVS